MNEGGARATRSPARPGRPRWPWALFGIAAVVAAATGVLDLVSPARLIPPADHFYALTILLFPAVGAAIAYRLPDHAIGRLFLGFGLMNSLSIACLAYARFGITERALPGVPLAAWTEAWSSAWLPPLVLAFLLLLFPGGRIVNPADRWLGISSTITFGAGAIGTALEPGRFDGLPVTNPMGIDLPGIAAINGVASALVTVIFVLVVVSLALRFRRSHGVERQQLKLFLFATSLMVAALALGNLADTLLRSPDGGWSWIVTLPFALGLLGIPTAVGVAILRYRLYDIDRIISRTIVYALVTGSVIAVYAGTVFVAGTVVARPSGDIAVAVATLAAATAFRPALTRIQSLVDRRFNRRRYDAQRTIDSFGARLRDETDIDELTDDLVGVVATTMQPAHVSLWLREAGAAQ